MKFLFVAGSILFLFSAFDVAFSQCDSRGIAGLKRCYGNVLNTGMSPNMSDPVNEQFFSEDFSNSRMCQIHSDKVNCLGSYENSCLNIPAFSQAFGITDKESTTLLLSDFTVEYMCNNNFPQNVCRNVDHDAIRVRCQGQGSAGSGNRCQFLTSYFACYQSVMNEECNVKDYVDYFMNVVRFGVGKLVPGCNL